MANQIQYDRSHERFTWKDALHPHKDPKKRFRILSRPRARITKFRRSCVYYSIVSALEAANRACGVNVDELSWESLHDMVDPNHESPTYAALRQLKYRGILRKEDYEKGNIKGKRFKISQFYEFCDKKLIEDSIDCDSGLDRNNIKGAIDSMLSKTVMLACFPISHNYYEMFDDGAEHIYVYDKDNPSFEEKDGRVNTHVVVITGFGFEETIPYFEFLDCNGDSFGKKGFGRILPTSIISLYGFDIAVD